MPFVRIPVVIMTLNLCRYTSSLALMSWTHFTTPIKRIWSQQVTVKTGMWFTTREQEIILTQLNRIIFFNLPDTIHAQPNVVISPSHGPQTLRIKYKGMDKTVVWYYPLPEDVVNNFDYRLESTRDLLWDIIESKPEYKALPPVKGGYQ